MVIVIVMVMVMVMGVNAVVVPGIILRDRLLL